VVPEAPGATRSHSLVIARSKGVATAALKASLIETKQQRGAFDADLRPRTTFTRLMKLGSLSLC